MKKFIFYSVIFFIPLIINAQAKFIYSGNIEFERKINVQRQFNENENSFFKDIVKELPPFYDSQFSLSFDSIQTTYYPSAELEPFKFEWIIGPAKENIVINDMTKGISNSNKQIFEKKYLVNDSLSKMKWKISSETRTIAGFECRKAVGIMCDSVYVVAFYTEEIPVSSGPESFNGLPGMILGIVIPRLYTTWFATKLNLSPSAPIKKDNKKGQPVDKNRLQTVLLTSFQNWGDMKQRNIWWVML